MTVITISHELGSGGRAIGRAVAGELSLDYIDHEIVQQVAWQLNMREEVAALREEHTEGIVGQILHVFADGPSIFLGVPPLEPDLRIDEATCHRATQAVIVAAARNNLTLIVGHGANFALASYLGVLNVFIYAPTDHRAHALAKREGISLDKARQEIARSDQSRAGYIRHRYHTHWKNPDNYDLMLNTAALDTEQCVEMIVSAWRRGSFGPFRSRTSPGGGC